MTPRQRSDLIQYIVFLQRRTAICHKMMNVEIAIHERAKAREAFGQQRESRRNWVSHAKYGRLYSREMRMLRDRLMEIES